jgi:serine/threonine protein kinase
LLGGDRWEPPDRHSDTAPTRPSIAPLTSIFRDFLRDPRGEEERRFVGFLAPKRAAPVSPAIKWSQIEIGRGDSSIVTISVDSNLDLSAVKTAVTPDHAQFIRHDAAILKTLTQPLILRLRRDFDNSEIATELAGNGSLANYPPFSECTDQHRRRFRRPNRIAKIAVGIALAMRYLHSRDVTHRDLKPDNILLDWDWTVRIADLGHSTSYDIPPIFRLDDLSFWPTTDWRYLAPECFEIDNCYRRASDVFSFGVILFELLAGRTSAPADLTRAQMQFRVAVREARPVIPEFISPGARRLIRACWATNPDDRPSFDEIVEWLEVMEFKLTADVDSAKVTACVRKIEEAEGVSG